MIVQSELHRDDLLFLLELTSKALRLLYKYQEGNKSLVVPSSKRKHPLELVLNT